VPPARGRFQRLLRTTSQILRIATRLDADLYHFHDPELIPAGLVLKLFGRRVVYDVHEDIAATVTGKTYIASALRTPLALIIDGVERLSAGCFDGIVAATPKIATRFRGRDVVIVQNFPSQDELTPIEAPRPYAEREPNVTYVGHVSPIRGLMEVMTALHQLPTSLGARLVIVGDYHPPSLLDQMKAHPGAGRTDFLGWQNRNRVATILAEARVGVVLFPPNPNHVEAQPNKLFEYMSAGLPIVASDFPLWRQQIEGAGCGLVVDPLDPAKIRDALRWLLEHPREAGEMGERGRAAARTQYTWDSQFRRLLQLYERIAARSSAILTPARPSP
jgi:glycosyltransferase involved in cell wall biosynthesis